MGRDEREIETYLKSIEENAHFSGAVILVKEGRVLFSKGYGYATPSTPNSPSTIFHIGSLTKQFTAAAILKLWESGCIDLNAPIDQYLPKNCQSPNSNAWKKVTVHHLLSHTSGISSYTDKDDYLNKCFQLNDEKIIQDARQEGLECKPGSEFEYCNTGYIILGKIIEAQSKVSYGEFVIKNLLIPAGMLSSGIHDEKYQRNPLAAIGYYWDYNQDKLVEDRSENIALTLSDGSLYSTVEDLAKWKEVLDGARKGVLDDRAIKMMTTPKLGDYGCGLFIDEQFDQKRIHHNGSIAGFRSDFCWYPESDIFIAVLCNNTFFSPDRVTYDISCLLFSPDDAPPLVIPFPQDFDFSPYLQAFHSERNKRDKYTFYLNANKHLLLQGPDKDDDPLECVLLSSECLFNPTEDIELELSDDGTIALYDDENDTLIPSERMRSRPRRERPGREQELVLPELPELFSSLMRVFVQIKRFWDKLNR